MLLGFLATEIDMGEYAEDALDDADIQELHDGPDSFNDDEDDGEAHLPEED